MKELMIRITEPKKKVSDFIIIKQISFWEREDRKPLGKTINIQRLYKDGEYRNRIIYSENGRYLPHDNVVLDDKESKLVERLQPFLYD